MPPSKGRTLTAQIAMMNKNAVALATDSAVTTRNARGSKVHNSANKLFTLSKYEPVGIMVHANAEFMGYPWETLIKSYRRQLGATSFDSIAEYADDFFRFLLNEERLFGVPSQEEWFRSEVESYVALLNNDFIKRVRKYFDENGKQLDEEGALRILEEFLTDNQTRLASHDVLPCYGADEQLIPFTELATPIVDSALEKFFQEMPIEDVRTRLRAIVVRRFITDSGTGYSGLVFAGFGRAEFLPVVKSCWIDGIFAGQLRQVAYPRLSGDMNQGGTSSIFPFAQSDSVYRFLQGIDPSYKTQAETHLDVMTSEITSYVRDSALNLIEEEGVREVTAINLDVAVAESRQKLAQKLVEMEQLTFLLPVMEVIASLPKEDLAAIAESLVNLTSFQRKILQETETVGGPIDVAVISKGDGFVWIHRKHYFEKDLNPAFFANYYRGGGDAD